MQVKVKMSQVNDISLDDAVALTTVKKRNFTRQYNACGKVTTFASANPSTDVAANVKKTPGETR